ncbi:hypothetical protein HCG51_23360 [Tolypothrix sp. PCC 7910]|uniref:CTB family bacteriocin n=1 Tax=Tolypothrix sp. PCC 7910 TaxID=2099387 RepID=UPI0014279BC4|nr:CTB family bacteriocin [Tolypothrix sp. PCC 7910]QIR39354.1 hypothetical protein HCG51_23360 [Tolypothrix sp. PCC 7910]
MSNELFTAVSVEEQEIVTGGVINAGTGALAEYLAKITNTNISTAGPSGATGGSSSSVDIKSLALNFSFLTGL